ncbi:MAG: YfcC family protein [bacterium]|nr:YfcC family protein [bacterium]
MTAKKETVKKKNLKFGISAFSIILILIILLAILTHFLPSAKFVGDEIVNGSGVVKATLANVLLSPVEGFADAIDVCIFVFVLGGFLNIVAKTGALETGIKVLVQKLKGNELILIPILMLIFSIGGTTYGMLEETVGFYALLAATMVAAGMDTIVASATVLLGAGVGVLGSTINPFANGAAISSIKDVLEVNQGTIIMIGLALWLASLVVAIIFVMSYAAKVKKNKGSTFLSLQEQKVMEEKYGKEEKKSEKVSLTGKQKTTLILFAITFAIMIFGFIPYVADIKWLSFSSILTGETLGNWYFMDASVWFLIMAILIGIVNGQGEGGIVKNFVSGAADMMSVILIIAVARGASYLMGVTHLDNYIIYNAADALRGMPVLLFTPLNYILHIILSILVPSSSGLAALSTPIMAPLASELGYSVEGTIMTFVAANGLVNLITPTCGAIMGGLALAGVEYSTWFKWAIKVVGCLALVSVIILTLAMLIF